LNVPVTLSDSFAVEFEKSSPTTIFTTRIGFTFSAKIIRQVEKSTGYYIAQHKDFGQK